MKQTNIAAIRTDYKVGELSEDEVLADAIEQFQRWFDEAIENKVMEPNAMVLSTVSDNHRPSSRVVLLKDLNDTGFGFYTNYDSQKGGELALNNYASLLFFWPELQRQVRVEGRVEKMPSDQSDAYFHSRPLGSQLGAVASPQSMEIKGRAILDHRLAEVTERFKGVEAVPRPDNWGGYLLIPDRVEFWQGRADRLHDRLVYKRDELNWIIARLAP